MSTPQDLQWSQAEQLEQMVPIQDMDFSTFLDIGDIDLTSFPSLEQEQPNGLQPPNTPFDPDMQGMRVGHAAHDFAADNFDMPMQMGQDQIMHGSHNGSNTDLRDFAGSVGQPMWNGQQHSLQQDQNNTFRPPHHIPPTPNSYEFHGNDAGRYMQQQMDAQTRAFLEQRYQMRKDEFTPLVSPAVTPQDAKFQTVPEYTIPGAYFSPLTSPALRAQNNAMQQQQFHHIQGTQGQGHHTQPSTAGSSAATSPVNANFDVDMFGADGLSLPEPARRSSRKLQAPRSVGPAGRVRQSPIVKPRKRKSATLSSSITPKDVDAILHQAPRSQPSTGKLSQGPFQTADNSSADSISPEALSEALMGPPPKPGSALQSPNIMPENNSASSKSAAPATPASLMSFDNSRRPTSSRNGVHPHSAQPLGQQHHDAGLEDFALPPSATPLQPVPASGEITPRISVRKTPKLGPLSTASSITFRATSATSSPAISAMASPMSVMTPSGFGKAMDKNAKSNKKRGSVSTGSNIVSPALRPKISPSIKPLLPDGGSYRLYTPFRSFETELLTCLAASLNDSQHALLLASKSNYTHLLEGTLLPGVSYPESLSSGLTSKRTSHKIAEQGRRNRINDALKEMQALLPALSAKDKSTNGHNSGDGEGEDSKDSPKTGGGGGSSSEAKAANSKAATVESAIEYIKVLQRDRMQMEMMLRGKDEEMTMLRKRLRAADIDRDDGSASVSSASGSVKGPAAADET